MTISELIDAIVETAGEGADPANADAEALGHYVRDLLAWRDAVLDPALDSIMYVHDAGGIDLDMWPEVERLFAPIGEDD